MRAGAVGLSAVVCCWVAAAGQGQAEELSPKESAAEQGLGGVFSNVCSNVPASRKSGIACAFAHAWGHPAARGYTQPAEQATRWSKTWGKHTSIRPVTPPNHTGISRFA